MMPFFFFLSSNRDCHLFFAVCFFLHPSFVFALLLARNLSPVSSPLCSVAVGTVGLLALSLPVVSCLRILHRGFSQAAACLFWSFLLLMLIG